MSNYTKTVDFAAKDALSSGNPSKKVLGTELNTEFANIATAIATKIDSTILSGVANPSASVGLTAVNGSATTYMRSDGAPALSQSIVPTWTGAHTFTALTTFTANAKISKNIPQFQINDTAQGADAKLYKIFATGGTLSITATNDADSVDRSVFSSARSGNAVTAQTFGNATDNPTYTFLGTGAISGVGSGLTALNASNVSSGTLALANGGTGSGTAAGARTNLGAAASATTVSVSGTGLSGGGDLSANRTITIDQTAMTTRNITGKSGITKTLSTSAASGGSDGDIWYRY